MCTAPPRAGPIPSHMHCPTPRYVSTLESVVVVVVPAQLNSIQTLRHPAAIFNKLMELIIRLSAYGCVRPHEPALNIILFHDDALLMELIIRLSAYGCLTR